MDKIIVEVKNLKKRFGPDKKSGLTAVDNISFSISEGEIVGLLGPNGAGKTTTIQMLLGLITPTNGDIKIFGKRLTSFREEILSDVNFSSTYTHLPWRLSVWENLYVVALLYSVENPKAKVEEVIKIMNLTKIKDTTIMELSSGWITRVNLARTLLNDPKLLLLDEPTASLDPEGAESVRQEILQFKKEKNSTILWTSHNMAEVEEMCDRVIFLHEGKILAVDTPQGLASTIKFCRVSLMVKNNQIKLFTLAKEKKWKITVKNYLTTVELVEEDIPSFLNLLAKAEIIYTQISIDKPTLEDFFISSAKKKH